MNNDMIPSPCETCAVSVELLKNFIEYSAPVAEDAQWFKDKQALRAVLAQPAAPVATQAPVTCSHEWTDNGEFTLICTACGAQEDHDPKWRDIATAPRDGSLVRLLVRFTENATEDEGYDIGSPTVGSNSFDDTGKDVWQFAGWSWEQDCYTQGEGEVIGWLPMLDTPRADAGEVEQLRYKAELYDEVWELATGLGFMNVTTAISKLRAQLAELEARVAPVRNAYAFLLQCRADTTDNAIETGALRDAYEWLRTSAEELGAHQTGATPNDH